VHLKTCSAGKGPKSGFGLSDVFITFDLETSQVLRLDRSSISLEFNSLRMVIEG
jgi:hypothetical protein